MFNTLKTIIAVAVSLSLLASSASADAIKKWATGEFSLSTLSEKERIKELKWFQDAAKPFKGCLLYTSPSPRDGLLSRMPSSA